MGLREPRTELSSPKRQTVKGDAKVIAILNEVLKAELTAINQYFLHAEMCENWGYERMAKHTRKESIEEMQHAEKLMERILLLDGAPNMTDYFKINIGQTLKQQLENDLQLEYAAVKRLNDGIKASVAGGDNGSRELMEKSLLDEEHHIDYLEGQLHAIEEMTYENYLAQLGRRRLVLSSRFSVFRVKRGGPFAGCPALVCRGGSESEREL